MLAIKKLIICALSLSICISSFGQAKIELQLGGSNFLGITVNSAYDIPISKYKKRFLSPSFGIGIVDPNWAGGPTSIIHARLDYKTNKFGIGCEVSNFLASPFGQRTNPVMDVNLVVYPNISYTFSTKINLYFNVSGGSYFAFSERTDQLTGMSKLEFEGDVIPGAGLTAGYVF